MAGKVQTATYKIDLDTSSLIKNFEDAINAMKKAGANGKITDSLARELDNLKRKSDELTSIGRFGVEGSKGIQSFDTKVKKLYESYGILGDKIKQASKNSKDFSTPKIEALQKEIVELQKKLSTSFDGIKKKLSDIGIGADITEQIGKDIKSQEELNKKLEEEKAIRKQILDEAKTAAESAKKNATSSVVAGKKTYNQADFSGKRGDVAAATSLINESISKGILEGRKFEEIWDNIRNFIKDSGVAFNDELQAQEKIRKKLSEIEEQYKKTAEAKNLISAQKAYDAMGGNSGLNIDGVTDDAGAAAYSQAAEAVEQLEEKETQLNEEAQKLKESQKELSKSTENLNENVEQEAEQQHNAALSMYDSAQAAEKFKGEVKSLVEQVTRMFSITAVFNSIRQAIKQTVTDLTNLDKSFASIAMVTNKTLDEMWSSYGDYNQMAQKLGQTTDSVIKASALFYQQGLNEAEALVLTENTMKLATLAGNDYATATQEMTAAIRGFKMEMDEGSHVTDVYSTLAASAAASVDDIAQAMSRTASIANSAGMSFENTSAFLTQMIETTQESAENIGTSLKTIIARFTELKENVAGTADSEFDDLDFNKVDKALKSVGVSLKDTNGQFRNLDTVFLELSKKWDSLDRNTQRYVATIAAGSRQQSRFIAMMDNYERTAELMEIAAEAEGKADEQFAKYADTVEYKVNQMKAKWEEFRTSLLSSDTFKSILNGINSLMDRINNIKTDGLFNKAKLAGLIPLALWAGKTFIDNVVKGMSSAGKGFSRIFSSLAKKATSKFSKENKLQIQVELNEAAMKAAEAKVKQLQKAIDPDGDKQLLLTIATKMNPADIQDVESLQNAIKGLGLSEDETKLKTDQLDAILNELKLTEDGSESELEELILKLKEYALATQNAETATQAFKESNIKQQAVQKGLAQGTSVVTSSVGLLISTLMAGGDAADAFKGMLISVAMQGFPILLSGIGEVVAGVVAGAESIEVAMAAATMGISLLITAIVAAVAALGWWIASDTKAKKEAASSAKQLTAAQEEYNDAVSKEQEHKNNIKDLTTEKESIQDVADEYEKLSKKAIKTSDEEARMTELKDEILEKYPEIVSYEDKQTKILHIQNDLIDEKLKKLDAQIATEKKLSLFEQAKQTTAKAEIDKQESIQALNNALGINIDANYSGFNLSDDEKTDSLLLAALNGRDLTNVSMTNMKESVYNDGDYTIQDKNGRYLYKNNGDLSLGDDNYSISELRNFYDKVLGGVDESGQKIDFDKLGSDVKNNILSLYLDAIDAQGLQSENIAEAWKKGATDFSETVKNVSEKLDSYLENYDYFKEYYASDATYANENELQKNIRASMAASVANEKVLNFSDIKSKLKYSGKHVYDDLDTITKQLGISDDAAYKAELDTIRDNYEKVFNAIGQGHFGLSNSYADAVQDIIDDTELTKEQAEEILEEIGYGKDTYSDTSDAALQKAMAKAYFVHASQKRLEEKGLEATEAANEVVKKISELQMDGANLTAEEYIDKLNEALNNDQVDDNTKKIIQEGLDWDEGDIAKLQEQLSKIYNDESIYSGLSVGIQQALADANQDFIDQAGSETLGNALQKSLTKTLQSSNIDPKYWKQLLQIDWSQASDPDSFDEFKKNMVAQMEESGVLGAESLFDKMAAEAEEFGALNISIDTDEELEAFLDKLEDAKDKIENLGKSLTSTFQDMLEAGEVSFETFTSLADAMADLDLNVYEYVSIDEEGKITATQKDLEGLYEAQLKAQKKKIENSYKENQLKINELKTTNEILKTQLKHIDVGDAITLVTGQEVTKQIELYKATHAIVNELRSLEGLEELTEADLGTTKITDDQKEIAKKAVQAQIDANNQKITNYEETNKTLKENLDNFDDYSKAAIRNYQNNNKALLDSIEEQTDATEKLADAQEKLNEALQEYNELLYGTDNRKSGLDLLYNYEQAISDFNSEISRSKELFDEADSIDAATEALQRYAEANHNLIAEEKAKQQVLQASLKNYESQILTGITYNDVETGNKIDIDFSDYVRKDERTGLYILDQQILDEAKFSDKWKEYLEQQVDAYNKYAEDLKKTDDEIRKAEKQMKELREAAVKSYASMEKEIADTLKAEYEKEVDNLKDKYEAMKDADDDYLDALQDAIQRQRDLRDQANQYEDLAEKEKKLSLMQRDTSGGNRVEVMQLEDEIQQDREQLLDDAIDKVIDGLSELYESQEELRDTEIELKEALLDNTAYWNSRAESVAKTFQTAEDYMAWMAEHSTEFAELTLTQQEEKLNEYGATFSAASQLMAINAMNSLSATGDYINEQLTVTQGEVTDIVKTTGEALTNEATRVMNETKTEFLNDMDEAIKKIKEARDAYNEAAEAALAAAQKSAQVADNKEHFIPTTIDDSVPMWLKLRDTLNGMSYSENGDTKTIAFDPNASTTHAGLASNVADIYRYGSTEDLNSIANALGVSFYNNGSTIAKEELFERIKNKLINENDDIGIISGNNGSIVRNTVALAFDYKKFKNGGLADYTGPAWVDGTPSKPEAFLSAEDTENIGNAARILANIPYLNTDQMTQNTETNINNSAQTNIEVNLYIDNISSDVDMDNAIERMKQEITDAANPVGTVNILQKTI